MKNKTFNFALFVCLGILLPLSGKPILILDIRIYILIFFTGWLIFSQPEFSIKDVEEKKQRDKMSLELIFFSSLFSIILTLIDSAYFQAKATKTEYLVIGLSLMLLGILFRIWSIKTLGRFFTTRVEFKQDHTLIQKGPYKYFRHPSYTGAYMVFLGVPILFGSTLGFIFTGVCMGLAYQHRIKAEEHVLIKGLGQQYLHYISKSYGLIPFI